MKHNRLIKGIIYCFAFLCCQASVSAQDKFDLAADFSASLNPNGPWSFGWISASNVFQLYSTPFAAYGLALQEWRGVFPSNDGSAPPDVICNPTDSAITVNDTTWLPHQVTFHPGQNGELSVIRWTSPLAGTIKLAAALEGRSTFVTSEVVVRWNDQQLFSAPVNGAGDSSRIHFRTNLVGQVGDRLEFRVNYGNGSWSSDTTQISVSITPVIETKLHLAELAGSLLQLTWSTNSPLNQLETSFVLPATNWMTVTNQPVLSGGQFILTVTATNNCQFYRLKQN